jgi:hypothetical protein
MLFLSIYLFAGFQGWNFSDSAHLWIPAWHEVRVQRPPSLHLDLDLDLQLQYNSQIFLEMAFPVNTKVKKAMSVEEGQTECLEGKISREI